MYLEYRSPSEVHRYSDRREGIIALRTKKVCSVRGISGFERDGVCYLPSCTPEDIRRLLAESFEVILAEIPGWRNEDILRVGMFDRVIFVFSAKPWRYPLLQSVLRQMLSENNDVVQGEYCSFGLTMQEMKTIRTEFGLHCKKISFIQDPFCMEKEDLRYLNSFLK